MRAGIAAAASARVPVERSERPHRYRALVIAALARVDRPASAQDVHAIIRAGGGHVGLSTVYRELHALTAMHRVQEIHAGAEATYRVSGNDVLVCDGCGRTQELRHARSAYPELRSFFENGSSVAIHGRCRACAETAVAITG